ncbi:phage integrase SAM-like domain-containing protein [Chryseobacterium tructae]|uniref:Phage integrase SAM-like domain-containing protein n=1 Tax=Chryseobacterium tructae TaxID=1037380 RepID=A0ABV7XUS2_9FLAO|nr:phage integrase SAM-like domain-containing protein [Chryseobacterium tructae]MDN3691178.1 phage integrase SAM-like domain-containing protein [Chryseobacterium tructae]
MASVSFFIRGKIADKESTIWAKFRDRDIDIRVPVPYLSCKPKDWKDGKCRIPSKKMHKDDVETINTRLSQLEASIISSYVEDKPELDLKEWLKSIIEPKSSEDEKVSYSDDVVSFIDIYISLKKDSITESTVKKANVVKQLLQRYTDSKSNKTFRNLKFKDLDNNFRIDFEKYCQNEMYKISNTYKNLKFLKMVCNVAVSFDIEVHKHVKNWKFEVEKVTKNDPKSIYLTFGELDKIEQTEMPNDHLDNARDWLLIACYTGQRVSDYLKFTSSMIVEDTEGQKYLEFIQQKTNAKMKIPLLKKVQEILDKRAGEFPRRISDVKFNLYIKDVCKTAGIDDVIYNGKVLTIEREGKPKITRKVFAEFPKHELVTSHIGRKSFASNFYGIIATTYLLNFTGHATERQLLAYINKTETEKAKATANVFKSLGY